MSDTLLILHVKGTEAETTALPRHAVQSALSQGQITNSQLIWSVAENTWKQAKEFPGLIPLEHLILHVKGTEAETRELPKHAVRTAISEGQITHSQLIWSPVDSSWKQAKEFPDLLPGEHLILHVKGTESETKELPKRAVRSAISQGQITHSQLIWSPSQNTWKQVRELPDLLPSQKLAPAPTRIPVTPHPRVAEAIIPESPGGPVARAAAAAGATVPHVRVASAVPEARVRVAVEAPPKVRVMAAGNTPHVRVATPSEGAPQVRVAVASAGAPHAPVAVVATGAPQVRVVATPVAKPIVQAAKPVSARAVADLKVKEADEFNPLKWLCIGMGILILVVAIANYLLVDRPLASNMSQTAYASITEYAHFGAFLQPNVMVIHIPRSATLSADNFTDFLTKLARNTPENPLTNDLFSRVALTSGWTAQYSFSGFAWKEIGGMGLEDKGQLQEDILERLGDGSGQPLMPESTLSLEAKQAKRNQVWDAFVAHFVSKP